MQTPPRRDHQVQVYQRRARKKVEGNAEEIMELPVPVIHAEQKPVLVYARRGQQPRTGLTAKLADSAAAAMNISGEEREAGGSSGSGETCTGREVLMFPSLAGEEALLGSEIHGQGEATDGAGFSNSLDVFRVEDAAITGVSSAAMSISGENREASDSIESGQTSTGTEALSFPVPSYGQEEAWDGAGIANLLDVFRVEDAAITGVSSAAMSISGEKREPGDFIGSGHTGTEVLKFPVPSYGQEEAGDGAGIAKLLDAFSVDDVALAGISFTELLNSSSVANLASFSMERGSAIHNGDRDSREDKEDATCSTSFGANQAHHNETMGCTRADPSNPSTPVHGLNSPRIRKLGIDLNKTPRQTPRKKKHPTPKIFIEGKPVKTPKSKTQGNGSSTGKKKYVRKNIVKVVEGLSTPAVIESKYLSKGMESPITPEKDPLKGHCDPGFESPLLLEHCVSKNDHEVLESQFEGVTGEVADPSRENSCKRSLNFDDESHLQDTKKPKASIKGPGDTEDLDLNLPPPETAVQSRVQVRGSKRSQCLITCRTVAPNFPIRLRRRRMARLRKAMEVVFPYLRKKFKKKRSRRKPRENMLGILEFIHGKKRKLTKISPSKRQPKIREEAQTSENVKEMKEKSAQHSAQEELLHPPACNLMPKTPPKKAANDKKAQKAAEKKAQKEAEKKAQKTAEALSREVEYLIHKLMHLSIEEEVQALVPYKPKQKTPKVLLDMETMRAWNLLMTLPPAEGDSSAEAERQREENWERERIKFRERVENFSSLMHMILGDRRFTAWKGSVVDSVVGVFLTQNVSDFLSSSAFMAVCAKFPPKSEIINKQDPKVGGWSEPTVEHPGPVSPAYDLGAIDVHEIETDVGDGIRTRPSKLEDECSGVTEERGYVQAMLPVSTESSNDFDISPAKENQLEGEGSSLYTTPYSLSQESSSNVDSVIKKTDSENVPSKVQELDQETVETNTVFEGTSENNHVHVVVDTAAPTGKKKTLKEEKKVDPAEWVKLGRMYSTDGPRPEEHMDSVDWEAVRCAKLEEVAETIRERGQHYIIGSRIQEFLNRVVTLHGSIDLEWLRHCPPDKVKDYLLDVNGLGLKSVECVRLLCLQNMAFPVDTNVGRIAVRLGWVPLQPLPDNLQLHLLEKYPIMDEIQKYLWPRLCTLDQRTLYELHYHLITFGKVFCTKRSPNCNACPLRGDCKHFASAFASAHPLPAPSEENTVTSIVPVSTERSCANANSSLVTEFDSWVESNGQTSNSQPIIEVPASPEPENCSSPLRDIEDLCLDNDGEDEIPTIQLNSSEFVANLRSFMNDNNIPIQENSTALVALTSSASLPLPKLKYVSRLRTEHQVYELPDFHPLVAALERREPDDPCPYLLAIWPTASSESSEPTCKCQISGELCDDEGCHACRDPHSGTVKGTILIPCRTAMRGSFPLNGTYFQVNEVFADHESSRKPIDVPRTWIWNLRRRIAYFGTSTSTIFRGLSTEKIQYCFWRGFVCVRGFDRQSRAPRPLSLRFHRSISKQGKGAAAVDDDDE